MTKTPTHVEEVHRAIDQRKKQREQIALEHRGTIAAELIADELALLHAEMSIIRELLTILVSKTR